MVTTKLSSLVCMQREDGSVAETDRTIVRNRHEEMGKRLNDPMRKNAHDMLKIEGKLITHIRILIVYPRFFYLRCFLFFWLQYSKLSPMKLEPMTPFPS